MFTEFTCISNRFYVVSSRLLTTTLFSQCVLTRENPRKQHPRLQHSRWQQQRLLRQAKAEEPLYTERYRWRRHQSRAAKTPPQMA